MCFKQSYLHFSFPCVACRLNQYVQKSEGKKNVLISFKKYLKGPVNPSYNDTDSDISRFPVTLYQLSVKHT